MYLLSFFSIFLSTSIFFINFEFKNKFITDMTNNKLFAAKTLNSEFLNDVCQNKVSYPSVSFTCNKSPNATETFT